MAAMLAVADEVCNGAVLADCAICIGNGLFDTEDLWKVVEDP